MTMTANGCELLIVQGVTPQQRRQAPAPHDILWKQLQYLLCVCCKELVIAAKSYAFQWDRYLATWYVGAMASQSFKSHHGMTK